MARAKNKPGTNRIPFQVRLTPTEKRELIAGAKHDGLPLSSWLRVIGLAKARENIQAKAA